MQGQGLPSDPPAAPRVREGRCSAAPWLGAADLQSCDVPGSPALDGAVGFVRVDNHHQERDRVEGLGGERENGLLLHPASQRHLAPSLLGLCTLTSPLSPRRPRCPPSRAVPGAAAQHGSSSLRCGIKILWPRAVPVPTPGRGTGWQQHSPPGSVCPCWALGGTNRALPLCPVSRPATAVMVALCATPPGGLVCAKRSRADPVVLSPFWSLSLCVAEAKAPSPAGRAWWHCLPRGPCPRQGKRSRWSRRHRGEPGSAVLWGT